MMSPKQYALALGVLGAGGLVGGLAGGVLMGGRSVEVPSQPTGHAGREVAEPPDVVRAVQFVVVDRAGNERAVIGCRPGRAIGGTPAIDLLNESGKKGLSLQLNSLGQAGLLLYGEKRVPDWSSGRRGAPGGQILANKYDTVWDVVGQFGASDPKPEAKRPPRMLVTMGRTDLAREASHVEARVKEIEYKRKYESRGRRSDGLIHW